MGNNFNEISDLGLAASLSVMGFEIVRVDRSNPKRVVFVFEKTPEIDAAVNDFWSEKLLLPATSLLDHIRKLKYRIYG